MCDNAKQKWVSDLMGKMNTEQKVGQLLVLGMCGPNITPDVVELIKKYQLGGLRISQGFREITLYNDVKPGEVPDEMTLKSLHRPTGRNRDYSSSVPIVSTPREYAETLNTLRQYSLDRPLSIPMHFTIDQEGSASDDLLSGQRLFPHPMGLKEAGDPQLTYQVAKAIAMQARALGVNMIHSPTIDVNTNPRNPEIGTRAYSDKTADVIEHSLQTLKGFSELQLMATGKHFPGRGESEADAHWGLPSVNVDRKTLEEVHIAPYKKLIAAGLPCIMMAHCCYPALGVTDIPAGMSKELIQNFLRGELGFQGVITTDNMMMGGVLKHYEMSDAIVEMLVAGCDLILCRDESPIRIQIFHRIMDAVRSKVITERMLDEKVQRILELRYDMGLAQNGGLVDASKAGECIDSEFVKTTATQAAKKSTIVLRDSGLLPIQRDKKILLIEQIFPTQQRSNNMYSHPGLLWEELCRYSDNVFSVEIPNVPTEKDFDRVMSRVAEADIVVATNYYYHKTAADNRELIRKVMEQKPVVVVSNTPYEMGSPDDFGSIIVSFNPGGRECMNAVAQVICGTED